MTTGTVGFDNGQSRLVTFDEPVGGVLTVDSAAFGRPLDGPLHLLTVQFTNGGSGGTADVEVRGPAQTWSQWAADVAEDQAVLIDRGRWTGVRLTFSGTGGTATTSLRAQKGVDGGLTPFVAELAEVQAEVAALDEAVEELQEEIEGLAGGAVAYGIDSEATAGASSDADVAFDKVATLPGDKLTVGDEVRGRCYIEVTSLNATPEVIVRFRGDGFAGQLVGFYNWSPSDIEVGSKVEIVFWGRVHSLGADLVLHGCVNEVRAYKADDQLLDYRTGAAATLTIPGPTSGPIDFVASVQFDAAHADNVATLRALSFTRTPRVG